MNSDTKTANGSSSSLATVSTAAPAQGAGYTVVPNTFTELKDFCRLIAASDLAPKDYAGKPGNVLVAVQMGAEVGLKPMQAIQNIAVINGRPSVWGDAFIGLIKQHPLFVSCDETIAGSGDERAATCTMLRKGEPPVTRTFSVNDAKRAGLWNKPGPWQTYPDRMLQMRARGFAGRDSFPDAIKGLSLAEEAMDIPHDGTTIEQVSAPAPTRGDEVRTALAEQAQIATAQAEPPAPPPDPPAPQVDDHEKRKDLRKAIATAWKAISTDVFRAMLNREYAKSTIPDLTTAQMDDLLERTPELLQEYA